MKTLLSVVVVCVLSAAGHGTARGEVIEVGGRKLSMKETGSATRTKGIFRVYEVTSYIEEDAKVFTAEDMIKSDAAKHLHLVFLRGVAPDEMAATFVKAFRGNYPEPAFEKELDEVVKLIKENPVKAKDRVAFTHLPKVGFVYRTPSGQTHTIRNPEFSRAIWGNYFGKHNAGENVKEGLLSKLPKS